ncbi:MAG: NUDIX hydrolase [Acidimicrobiales bacterium]
MTITDRHSVSVAGAAINDQGEVLAIRRRDNGRWEPAGGILDLGEALRDGVRREVLEETGLQVEPDALTGVYQNIPRSIVAFVFRCYVIGGHLHPTTEATDVAWLTAGEIADRMHEAYAVRLLDALSWTPGDQPVLRVHDGVHVLPAKS